MNRKTELQNMLYADGNVSNPNRNAWAEELAQIEAEELAQTRAKLAARELEIIEKISSYSKAEVLSEALPYCCPLEVHISESATPEEAEFYQLREAFEMFFDGRINLLSTMKSENLIKYLKD